MNLSSPPCAIPLTALSLFLLAAPPAFAQAPPQQSAAAQTAFDEAMKLMGEGRPAEACPKFAAAQRLDPGMATQFRLAQCYEKIGRLASAWANYVEVADAAKAAKSKEREAVARARVAALGPRLSRLTIVVPPALATLQGLEIKRDGSLVDNALWGTAIPVDPGEHLVVTTAPGKKPWQGKGTATEEPTRLAVTIPPLEDLPPSPVMPKPLVDSPPPEGGRSRVPALAGGAVAVAAVGVGVGLFFLSVGKRDAAQAFGQTIVKEGGTCLGGAPDKRCEDLKSMALDVDTFNNLAIGSFVGAGVLAAGALTYLLWPNPRTKRSPEHSALQAAPLIGLGKGGMILSGAF